MRNKRLSFSLVEVIVILVIIAILIELLIPAIKQASEAAERAKETQKIEKQLEAVPDTNLKISPYVDKNDHEYLIFHNGPDFSVIHNPECKGCDSTYGH